MDAVINDGRIGYELTIYTVNGMTISEKILFSDMAIIGYTEKEVLALAEKVQEAWLAKNTEAGKDKVIIWGSMIFFAVDVLLYKIRPIYTSR